MPESTSSTARGRTIRAGRRAVRRPAIGVFAPAGVIVLAGVLVAAGPAAPAQGRQPAQQRPSSLTERIDAVFADYDNTRSPGCALGVVRAGDVVLARGYGMANLEHGVPITSRSVFRIGSTSKQFTAAAVLLLEREGKLSLDDDVRRFLPELPSFDRPVTLRQLLHHTSGYRDYLTLMSLAGYRDDDYYTDEDLLEMLSRQRQLNFTPGTEHLYSNSGYWLLSQVVERASGESLREYAAEKIFEPLGMLATHFHDDHTEIVPHRAAGYAPDRDDRDPRHDYVISMTTLPMIGDGGVFTSVDDLVRWDRNFYEPLVGGPGFGASMYAHGVLESGEELDYASALAHGTYRGLRTVSHGGSFVGFRAEMMRFPEQRTTIICLCNRADADPTRRARRVADVVLENDLGPPEPQDDQGSRERDEPQVVRLSAAERHAYVGDYHSDELDVVYRVRGQADGLVLGFGRRDPMPLEPIGEDRLRAGALTLRFQRDDAGGVTGFLLDAGRVKNLRFERLSRQ